MCRLFGFRSVFSSKVHSSLIGAENALIKQSNAHADGWGVAYYQWGVPHILKTTNAANQCEIFDQLSGVVTSTTVLGHLRKATVGDLSITNAHPFQFGPWVFAHNGNIKNFERYRSRLLSMVDSPFKNFILGKTDSELIFFILLSHLHKEDLLEEKSPCHREIFESIAKSVNKITDIIGPTYPSDDGPPDENYLTFLLTDGKTMLAHQGGKDLYYSTHKKSCPEKDNCSHFNSTCESVSTGVVNHILFSSEPLSGENIWNKLAPGEIIGIDQCMQFYRLHKD